MSVPSAPNPVRLVVPITAMLVAAGGIWLAYAWAIDRAFDDWLPLRGTWFWDLRYLVFGCVSITILSVVERLSAWMSGKLFR